MGQEDPNYGSELWVLYGGRYDGKQGKVLVPVQLIFYLGEQMLNKHDLGQ